MQACALQMAKKNKMILSTDHSLTLEESNDMFDKLLLENDDEHVDLDKALAEHEEEIIR